jgi:hypothetical protein
VTPRSSETSSTFIISFRRAAVCRDCHEAIHAVFTNQELETTYENDELAKMIRFIAKQHGRVRVRSSVPEDDEATRAEAAQDRQYLAGR